MILLLGILRRNNKYYMNVINTEKESTLDDYQFINQFILNNCENIRISKFLSARQNPIEYLRGDFDVSRLIVDDSRLRDRIKEFQIIAVYYNEQNEPIIYKSIDRAGNISMHYISEFEYTKNSSILGFDIFNLPKFVERKPLSEAKEYLREYIENQDITDIPVRLLKTYLINEKNFQEGYHTVTKINNGNEYDIHEYMLFNGITTIKLVEYVSKDKKVFMTKQDEISDPYPKERTAGFLSGPIIMLGSKRALTRFCKAGVDTEFEFYNSKTFKLNIPFSKACINTYDKYIKSKDVLFSWQFDLYDNLPIDIYKNILPNEIFKLPHLFYHDMKNVPYGWNSSPNFNSNTIVINLWIYTVSLFMCWQYFSVSFKKSIMPIMKNYKEMYTNALTKLVNEVGPKDALTVMKWTKENLEKRLNNILDSDTSCVTSSECLFTFHQNEYELPEELKIYREETITGYGGEELLKSDYLNANSQRKIYITRKLDDIEKSLDATISLKLDESASTILKQLNRKI